MNVRPNPRRPVRKTARRPLGARVATVLNAAARGARAVTR